MKSKATILVVDDDPKIRMCVRGLLEDSGYSVLEAEDGLAALAHLDRRPSAIILDLNMPRLDGRQFLEVHGPQLTIPVIVFSSETPNADEQTRLGAAVYLAKGCDDEEILQAIDGVLGVSHCA